TLQPHDALAIVFQPVMTPTGNVNVPPAVLLSGQPGDAAGSSAANLGYRWTRISFWLDVLLNGVSLGPMALRKPLTLE
ncbi:hypothetical protein, partial [Salmonella sp. SAL4435]|uniref:hypothetical protein n=1 Tax=Salmonella sp. SAL4435 TaxID=3159890 RepID=UPI00397962C7